MTTINQLLLEIDDLIQAGQIDLAQNQILEISKNKIPRSLYNNFVRLCWRSGNANIGMTLLNSLIKNRSTKLTSSEWLEYAMCLNSIGAVREAQKTMQQEAKEHELFCLYMAFSFIYQWDYEQAVIYLKKSLSLLQNKSYQFYVAQINLLASFVAIDDFLEANELFLTIKKDLPEKYKRLHSNLIEIQIQLLCGEKKFKEGLNVLEHYYSSKNLSGPEKIQFLKWKTILEIDAGQIDKEHLLTLAKTAYDSSMWEVARDCETRYAFITKNPIFIKRVYFGTPWQKFRDRILDSFRNEIDFSQNFEMWMFPQKYLLEKKEPSVIVDTELGIIGSLPLKGGSLGHRLIKALSTDLYRPHSLGSLFSYLFEDERYDISTSPNRIYRAISELRDLLAKEKIPLEIQQIGNGYKLAPMVGIKFKISPQLPSTKIDFKMNSLKSKFKDNFSAKEIADYMSVSTKTAQRIINSALEANTIEKYKVKTSVRYKWKA